MKSSELSTQPIPPPLRHILCVRLFQWAIDRHRRSAPQADADPLAPCVLVYTLASRHLVAAACPLAAAAGVRQGMTLSQARALCPGLTHAAHEPSKDLRALAALGRWLTRFTPVVALDPPDGLLLDISGCGRVFGGVDRLATGVIQSLARMKLAARVAVAPTVGAAWALASVPAAARGAKTEGGTASKGIASFPAPFPSLVLEPWALPRALAPLPITALRLDASAVGTLLHLGVQTIEQLLVLDRSSLLARFGPGLLLRIDQALGAAPEVLAPLPYRTPVRARMKFDGCVEAIEAI